MNHPEKRKWLLNEMNRRCSEDGSAALVLGWLGAAMMKHPNITVEDAFDQYLKEVAGVHYGHAKELAS